MAIKDSDTYTMYDAEFDFSSWSPDQRLLYAVLYRAIRDYIVGHDAGCREFEARNPKNKIAREFASAAAWFRGDVEGRMPFSWVCESLELDPESIVFHVRKATFAALPYKKKH